MNAICPRCGAMSLAGAQATRFTCKVCQLHFCNECLHWKENRKQKYCARCGATFSAPPPVMPGRLFSVVFYVPIIATLLLSAFVPLGTWQMALLIVAPLLAFTSAYLAVFYRRTGLAMAVRREAILLGRRALMLAAIVYVVMTLNSPATLVIGLAAAVALVFVGVAAQRMSQTVIEELQANRPVWSAVLAMSNWDALLMRFPDARNN